MRRLHYHLLDVFTDRAFGGNPLAVFTNGRDLTTETMQKIAREMNLSETTFVLPPDDPANHFRVRIFTPAIEMPMAGHPTVGTAYALALEHMLEVSGTQTHLRLEEQVGLIPVTLDLRDGVPVMATMRQPLPTFGAEWADRQAIADLLSIDVSGIDPHLPLEVVSCGVPFLFVPITDGTTMERLRLRLDVWERTLKDFAAPSVFAFTRQTVLPTSTVHSRMFAPAMGILEDPATGAASGPLGCYLFKHGIVTDSPVRVVSEQGFEMGRPSLIHIQIDHLANRITGVHVGGQCVWMGEGYLVV